MEGHACWPKQNSHLLSLSCTSSHEDEIPPNPQATSISLPCAAYYGEKLHIDQNEKLNRFRVTHILTVDRYSRKIVGLITIPCKNCHLWWGHYYYLKACGNRCRWTMEWNSSCLQQSSKTYQPIDNISTEVLFCERHQQTIIVLKGCGWKWTRELIIQ